jgi:hypothetical protein
MLHPRIPRRFTTWLALLALVVGTLAPSLVQAVAASVGKPGWVQVCSASGMFWVKAEADPAGTGESRVETSAACPWCSLHGGAAGLPPTPSLAVAMSEQGRPVLAQLHTDLRSRVWTPAQARAPPSVA